MIDCHLISVIPIGLVYFWSNCAFVLCLLCDENECVLQLQFQFILSLSLSFIICILFTNNFCFVLYCVVKRWDTWHQVKLFLRATDWLFIHAHILYTYGWNVVTITVWSVSNFNAFHCHKKFMLFSNPHHRWNGNVL